VTATLVIESALRILPILLPPNRCDFGWIRRYRYRTVLSIVRNGHVNCCLEGRFTQGVHIRVPRSEAVGTRVWHVWDVSTDYM
jgi:hypothetical protein